MIVLLTEPVNEYRDLPVVKCGRQVRLTASLPSVRGLCRIYVNLDVLQHFGPPRRVAGIALPPLWSSGQSSWLQNGDVLCFL
jgi:hypothetical protein